MSSTGYGDSHWSRLYASLKARRDELETNILRGTLDELTYRSLTGARGEVVKTITDMDDLMRGKMPAKREPLPPVD
jgi:hypothetical protein